MKSASAGTQKYGVAGYGLRSRSGGGGSTASFTLDEVIFSLSECRFPVLTQFDIAVGGARHVFLSSRRRSANPAVVGAHTPRNQ